MKTAREILLKHAWASVDKHDYLPTTDKEASEFIPHNWATKAVEEALEISQKESAQKLHSEIHKLSNIMEREFGDRVGRYFQSTGEDRQEYAADTADDNAEYWINKFFNITGEDKQVYINEVERLRG